MAVLSTTSGTLLDFAKRLGDDYKIGRIIELLSQTNEILDDMTFRRGKPSDRAEDHGTDRAPAGHLA
jgi:hypothetical protein